MLGDHNLKTLSAIVIGTTVAIASTAAQADEFESGSYIIPMDTDVQDEGILRAYGLVYELLRNGVPVRWVILEGKDFGDPDFTTSSTDVATGAAIAGHGYRAGPWVVDADDASMVIDEWIAAYPETTVHQATEGFEGDVARYLVVAPTIAMVADGNQKIARGYMQAAAIPDSALNLAWDDDSPDMLDIDELSGPTEDNHTDGSLFDEDGDPVYCQLMSMHWGVNDAEDNPEVVAEVRAYLNNPTHFFAECQAVNAFENLEPHGFFLTPNGFEFGDRPDEVDFFNADSPFGQLDGPFETVGGSEPSYTLPPGDDYLAGDIVMLTAAGTPEGVEDVWMTGFLDGECPPSQKECGQFGKISYLGGHEYSTDSPTSVNPDSQGTRLFLNSLFEAPCATVEGLPTIAVAVGAPAQTTEPDVTLHLTYVNTSFATALDAVLVDALPDGATFVSASMGGTYDGTSVTWDLGNLGPGESGDLEIEVTLESFGIYPNAATLDYRVGLNPFVLASNETETEYGDDFPSETSGGLDDTGDASGGEGGGSEAGNSDGATAGDDSITAGGTGGTGGSAGTGGGADGGDDDGGGGCGCTQGQDEAPTALLLGGLLGLLLRRRRAVVASAALLGGCGGDDASASSDSGTGGIATATDDGISVPGDDTGVKLDVGVHDVFQPPSTTTGCEAIDFLFIIDSSESMKAHQDNLIASFPGFAMEIGDAVPADNWHVMVVDTDAQWGGAECANACATLGACPGADDFACDTPSPALCDISIGSGELAPYGEGASNTVCFDSGGGRYLTNGAKDLESAFSCIAQVGVDGNSEERTAEAMVRSVSPAMLEDDACNEGFLRDEAILVVTIITDEPDAISPDDPPAWADAIIEAKGGDPEAVVVLGLLPDGGDDELCDDPIAAPRLGEFIDQFANASRASVCEPDYSPFLGDAVGVIVEVCDDFEPPPPQG